jgi:hypothetical protein
MKVFLSWSGELSHKVAVVFRDWLPSVIQTIEPYVSSEDIDKGARWSTDIAKELEDSSFGILCVTKDNIDTPWLNFEAGALSKTMDKSYVSPFLFDIKRSDVKGPILQFQSTVFDKDDIKKLIFTLNKACSENCLTEERLTKSFDLWYKPLEEQLKSIEIPTNPSHEKKKNKTHDEILEEILDLSRMNQKLLRNPNNGVVKTSELREAIDRLIYSDSRKLRQNDMRFKRVHPAMIEELLNVTFGPNSSFAGVQIAMSIFRNDFPWLFDAGISLIASIKRSRRVQERMKLIEEYRNFIELTFEHPFINDMYEIDRDQTRIYRDISMMIVRQLERICSTDTMDHLSL